jgi:steroid 5-alpha reductase family enzyme
MIAIVTVLAAFPLGFFLRSRLAANTAYAVAYLWAFVFQTLYLILDVVNDSAHPAFEPQKFPWAYGIVALSIFMAGFGLVALGHRVRDRRLARGAQPAGVTA